MKVHVDFELFLLHFVSSFTQCNSESVNFVNLVKMSISNHFGSSVLKFSCIVLEMMLSCTGKNGKIFETCA